MRRAAGAADDDAQAARDGAGDVFLETMRIAMGGDDLGLADNAEFFQGIGGGLHHGPVRITAHKNPDEWFGSGLV